MSAEVVLVVDDTSANRQLLGYWLRHAGFEVTEAASGAEALAALEGPCPDLIVLDVKLPDLDGREVCRRIKADPRLAPIPVLQTSAVATLSEDRVEALEGGADAYLILPVPPGEFLATARSLLRLHRAERQARLAAERWGRLSLELAASREEAMAARDAAEEAARAKATFLASMSHEIRTPMNAVIGLTSLLVAGGDLTSEQREMLEMVEKAGDHLLVIINDILDLSKIETGGLELERAPFGLAACVEEALGLVAPKAAEKGLDLAYLPGKGAPEGLVGDASRLRQVLVNLLSNALKFTAGGEVTVTSTSRVRPGGEHEVTFAVRDTGVGIAPEHLEAIFEPFRQVEAASRRQGGTGLGLAVSARLVTLMGGRMWVESEVGVGSTFFFTVTAEAAAAPVPSPFPVEGLSGRRVLVVDDTAANRLLVQRTLDRWGVEVVPCPSGAEALAVVEGGPPFDVALLDLEMPGMDGVELAAALGERLADRCPPLVLLSSAYLDAARAVMAEGLFTAVLPKPIRSQQLLSVVFNALGVARPAAPVAAGAGDGGTPAGPAPARLRVLLVEDNDVNLKVALGMLGRLGLSADVAVDGAGAVAAAAAGAYDLILMDLRMPNMDGWEATRAIRAAGPAGRRPRIVALTASVTAEERDRCLEVGMDGILAKPLKLDRLAEVVQAAVPPGP